MIPPSGSDDHAPRPRPEVANPRTVATFLYLLLLLAALLWCFLRTGRWLPDSLTCGRPLASVAIGAATAAAVVLASAVLVRFVSWMRWFGEEVRRILGPVDAGTALHLAIVSGVAEEAFFRGAMQPVVGYEVTSVVFGLVHVGPDRRFLSWTLFALAMGFVLGGILETTGSLVGPVLAHVVINFLNLLQIGRLSPPLGRADAAGSSGSANPV